MFHSFCFISEPLKRHSYMQCRVSFKTDVVPGILKLSQDILYSFETYNIHGMNIFEPVTIRKVRMETCFIRRTVKRRWLTDRLIAGPKEEFSFTLIHFTRL